MKDDKFKVFCHFVAGVLLLPLAFSFFNQRKFVFSGIFFVAGILFLFISATLDALEKKLGNTLKLTFLLESLVLFLAAYAQLNLNKRTLGFAFLGMGVVYFLLFIYYLYNKHKRKKHHRKRRSSSTSETHSGNTEIME